MKLPRWLLIGLVAMSIALVTVAAGWWWVTWPSRTVREFTFLLEQHRFDQADLLLKRPARLTIEIADDTNVVHFVSGESNPGTGRMKMYSPELWQSWCTLANLEIEPRSMSDVVAGRQAFSYHRAFITPAYIGGSAQRGSIILRNENWAAPAF